ncbi:MAG: hypothetical protein IJ572_02810 [Bacilli bacterium]|nr:hypothetical protein [Bacilli bacterium]
MNNYISKHDDVKYLCQRIKGLLKDKVVLGTYGQSKEILAGVYRKDPDVTALYDGIAFYIEYNSNYYLRLHTEGNNEMEMLKALQDIGFVLSIIVDDSKLIGEPSAYYKTNVDQEKRLYLEWCFQNKEEWLNNLVNSNEITKENLVIFDNNENNITRRLIKDNRINM